MTHVVADLVEYDEEGKETGRSAMVAHVRTTEGGVAKLQSGDAVPGSADPDHVATLVERGVLSEVEEPKPARGGNRGGGGSIDQN